MAELNYNPAEYFSSNKDKMKLLEYLGVSTISLELEDECGQYLAIPALPENKVFSELCGEIISGHLITRIDYDTFNGHTVIIKAYF